MKIDIQKLYELQNGGWIMSQVHPTLPLVIWNYTNQTQWEAKWNEFTLMCRALVTDWEGNIVAYPMKKFFNYSELAAQGKVPSGDFYTIYEKIDGSLIQLFNYKGEWIVSSRGSFTSDHANYAKEILESVYPFYDGELGLEEDCNYIFELIHPDTRIVVDYGQRRDLVLLAVIDKEGNEKDINDYGIMFTLANIIDLNIDDWNNVKNSIATDEEGYVIKFDSGLRMKIKGDEYCRLHRIITMTSSYDIWETLKSGKDITDLMERVPDEWMTWVYKTVGEIYLNYRRIHQQVDRDWEYGVDKAFYQNLKGFGYDWDNIVTIKTRGEIAKYFQTCQYPSLMFNKLDGVDYDSKIWEMVKPTHSKAFSI